MKILIIGNIGSGKTTLGKKIQELTGFRFVQIDEIREKFFKKKVSEEYYCLYEFLKAVEESENVILEFTGAGCHKYAIKKALELSNDKIIIVHCKNRDFSIINERVKNKEMNKNFPFHTDIENHINFIKEELDKDSFENFWQTSNSTVLYVYMDNSLDIAENMNIIKNKIKQMGENK
ncbi:MAG: shikimate kinase [Promethearchaeota archaeon]